MKTSARGWPIGLAALVAAGSFVHAACGGAPSGGATAPTASGAPSASSASSASSAGTGGEGGGGDTTSSSGGGGPGSGGAGGSGGTAGVGGGAQSALEHCEDFNATVVALAEDLGCTDPFTFDCPRVSEEAAEEGCPDAATALFDCMRDAFEGARGCECTEDGEEIACDLPSDTCAEEGEALFGERGCLPPKT